jgi:hypothetical protein
MTDAISKERLAELDDELLRLSVASCECLTKTPEIQYHDPSCRFRVLQECQIALRELQRLREQKEKDNALLLKVGEELRVAQDEIERLREQVRVLRPVVEDLVQYGGGMEYDDYRLLVQRGEEALAAAQDKSHE